MENGFEKIGALDDPGGDAVPLGLLDQQRNRRERPGALFTFIDDAEAGADIVGMALRTLAGVAEFFAGNPGKFLEQSSPGRVAPAGTEHVALRDMRAIVDDPPVRDGGGVEQ